MEEVNYSKFTIIELSRLLSQLKVSGRASATTKNEKIELLKNFSCVSQSKKQKLSPTPRVPSHRRQIKYYERIMNNVIDKANVKGALKKQIKLQIVDEIASMMQLKKTKEGEWEITSHLIDISNPEQAKNVKELVDHLYNQAQNKKIYKKDFIENLISLRNSIPEYFPFIEQLK